MIRRRTLGSSLALLLLATSACEEPTDSTFLTAPGESGSGVISGVLSFDGTEGGVAARIYALRGYDADCASQFLSIHLTGSYNDWDTSVWTETDGLQDLGGCVWAGLIDLSAGSLEWKFVTNGGWDNDYGSNGEDGLQGTCVLVTGAGNDLVADVPSDGEYHIILDESDTPASYLIAAIDAAPIATPDLDSGAFRFDNLPDGTYTLVIVAEGFLIRRAGGIEVSEGTPAELDPIDVVTEVTGALAGAVSFADDPDPLPTATVTVREAGGTAIVESGVSTETGSFLVERVPIGTYDVLLSASGYVDALLEDVEIVEGVTTTLDDVTLAVDESCEASTAIEIVGEFNNWPAPPTGPHAKMIGECLWAGEVAIDVSADADSTYLMKLRTNDAWDDDDWGSCVGEGTTFTFEGDTATIDVCIVGSSDALSVKYPASATYRFELDERIGRLVITQLP